MSQEYPRRSFLGWAIFGLGALFSTLLGAPVACYLLDPLHRQGKESDYKPVEGIRLAELPLNEATQGVVRDTRRDGWTLYPNDAVGRVWVIRKGNSPDLSTAEKIETFNNTPEAKNNYLLVFTTICPHLGCSVNRDESHHGFTCPCHGATFSVDGIRKGEANVAARDMDSLVWQVNTEDPNRIMVRYQNFRSSDAKKILA